MKTWSCVHEMPDGACDLLSDAEVRQTCVEAPCLDMQEKNRKKRIGDLTVSEVKEICKKHACDSCPLYDEGDNECPFDRAYYPTVWKTYMEVQT